MVRKPKNRVVFPDERSRDVSFVTRLFFRDGKKTYVYCYGNGEENAAIDIINEHVAIGRITPTAGILLCAMVEECQDES